MATPASCVSFPPSFPQTVRVLSVFFQAGLLCAALAGCAGDVGKAYRIDTANQPAYQDDNVRFQTTYYFRVFDVCQVPHDAKPRDEYGPHAGDATFLGRRVGEYEIVNDQLYRFRMTGKASALFSNVHFESGTLRAEEIDPFGAAVEYDEAHQRFAVRSAQETRVQQQRDKVSNNIKDLIKLRELVKDIEEAKQAVDGLIKEHVALLSVGRNAEQEGRSVSAVDIGQPARDEESQTVAALTAKLKEMRGSLESQDKTAADNLADSLSGLPANGDALETKKASAGKALGEVLKAIEDDISVALGKAQEAGKLAEKLAIKKKELIQTAQERFDKAHKAAEDKQSKLDSEKKEEKPDPRKVQDLEQEVQTLRDDRKKKETELVQAQRQLEAAIAFRKSILQQENILDVQRRRVAQFGEWLSKGTSVSGVTKRPSSAKCADGKMARRGFQIVGPEGIRDFDQDERLIMAMTTDAQPLIELLGKVSRRQLKGGEETHPSLLPLVKERGRLAGVVKELGRMELELASPVDGTEPKLSVWEMVKRLIQELERDGETNAVSGSEVRVIKDRIVEQLKYRGQ